MKASKQDWKRWTALMGAAAILSLSGCANRSSNVEPDAPTASGTLNNAVGDAAQDAVSGKIKTALQADASVGAAMINVETVEATKTVTLSGEVTNAVQKKLAESIAKKQAPDYKIDNKLTVKGGASPVMSKGKTDKKTP